MRIVDLLSPEKIALGASAADKEGAIDLLVDLQAKSGCLTDREAYKQAILARESQTSTAIEMGIAVPHAKSACVTSPSLAACILKEGVDYGAMDGQPSDLFFMIAAPLNGDLHLEILSHLMVLLMDFNFVSELRSAPDAKAFMAVIDKFEAAKFPEEAPAEVPAPAADSPAAGPRILAVTACPTGIAHTYMAAEALEKKGKELGISVKVETQGSGGAKNILTRKEIDTCDGIIIAADKEVDLARFDGKPVLRVPVSDGIHKPEELIRQAPDAPIYHHAGQVIQETASESIGRKLYKQLMNGVSHMLPFVIGGGILIALAFLLDDASIDYANFGTNTPIAAWFKNIGNTAFNFMLPILAGYIAMSIADRPGLMVGFVGGALAVSGATFLSPSGTSVSAGFLGALIAGFAGGYLMLAMRKVCDKLPRALEGLKPILIYPVVGLLIIGLFMCLINPIVGAINTALYSGLEAMGEGSKIILGIVLAGMMAVDMGGPFNKAAYVFGTSTLAAMAAGQGSDIMAAVMIGGMVPPIAIALATTFFRNRFTEDERKSGVVNYIMGLCFITEGAIPFAASDPLRVLPACIVGSGVAGALSMAFGCALPAPHGGIFVFPVMTNILGYVIALVVGSLVGMILLGLLKKKKN
ncbi:PTS fructose transporter subunit IIABC [Flavonifractor plautii]|uniref:PTS fructose transporter subunit IIABC n=1 Tax=Flavonifractor plautii TaxID=292800 RepID=UPI001956D4FF|nr:PTS fructose transporter subunit IIABC [Flavonifractor plautii]MBM6663301.1 PTS sugar transporter subunit IIA [Flavonifractor plautii]